VNYARRQQYRRLSHAGKAGLGSVIAALFGLLTASAGAAALAGLLLLAAIGLGLYARYLLSLASRSRVGAHSEDEVHRALAPLHAEGWRLRHSLPWRGRGDIDSLAVAPTGVGFVVETKTRRCDENHLARVRQQTVWLARRRRPWCRRGAVGVLCVVRASGVERVERDVIVVSIDRLLPTLVAIANARGAAGLGRP
jgi:Nuclease-related domain